MKVLVYLWRVLAVGLAVAMGVASCGPGSEPADVAEADSRSAAVAADQSVVASAEAVTSEQVADAPTQPPIEAAESAVSSPTPSEPTAVATAVEQRDEKKCIAYLHGKSGSGRDTVIRDDGMTIVAPDGNGTGWGGLQWEYDSAEKLAEATASIVASIDAAGCSRVVIHGFSNGASAAAALHCSGNDLQGRLVGVIIDDPVTDAATVGCSPATDNVALYWTGALGASAPAGTNCAQIDWTCAGDSIRGIDAYATDLGVATTASPHTDHSWNFQTELPAIWLG